MITSTRRRISLVAIVALALGINSASAGPALSLSLFGSRSVSSVDDFNVTATLKNTGDVPLKLYNYPESALSPFPARTFSVAKSNGDSHPAFIGPVVKYSFEMAKDFTDLAVGESKDIEHHLAAAFAFESTGTYSVDPSPIFYYQDADGNPVKIEATVIQAYQALLKGSLKSRHAEEIEARHQNAKRVEYSSCASTEQSEITESAFIASLYVADAEKYLTLQTDSTPRYVQWFGEYDSDRKDTVLSHYKNIRSSDLKTYTFDCDCTQDVYAYVYPDKFGHVYLCNQYWTAPPSGTDSKAGTMVHESSHFLKNGGTQDYAYGHSQAAELALENVTLAIFNADSHEYFAENIPVLE